MQQIVDYLSLVEKSKPICITTYDFADLDGSACAVAFEELLSRLGFSRARALFSEAPQREAEWVMRGVGVPAPHLSLSGHEDVFLVDVSISDDVPSAVDLQRVKLIIDHRVYPELEAFPQAVSYIERVGAAATLVAELFDECGVSPSQRAATLLYCAIASNTANLRSRDTTPRDIGAAKSLSRNIENPEQLVKRMFEIKSELKESSIQDAFDRDLSTKLQRLKGVMTTIPGLELNNVPAIFQAREGEFLAAIENLRLDRGADRAFGMLVDLESARTYFILPNQECFDLISQLFELNREAGLPPYFPEVISRKEVISRLLD